MFIFLIVNLLLHKTSGTPIVTTRKNGMLIKDVPCGETVLFQCLSNIKDYNFDYWLFQDRKIVIGPSNTYDKLKYRYEILSGNLTIRAVTKDDEGLYICVSKEVRGDSINVEHAKLTVQQGWVDVYQHSSSDINTIRILVILIILVILGAGAYYLYSIWRDRYRYPRYLEQEEDDDDDESAEEIFSAPGTSGLSKTSKPSVNIVQAKTNSFDTISTDFKSILDTANDK